MYKDVYTKSANYMYEKLLPKTISLSIYNVPHPEGIGEVSPEVHPSC